MKRKILKQMGILLFFIIISNIYMFFCCRAKTTQYKSYIMPKINNYNSYERSEFKSELSEKKRITFADENMYSKVRSELQQLQNKLLELQINFNFDSNDESKFIEMNLEDVSKVVKLELNNSNITSISGISNFTQLKELDISNNNIKNIDSLQYLENLEILRAYGNRIESLEKIESLTKLEKLNISKNKLQDLENGKDNSITNQISKLINLTELDISHNYLRYTNGLSGMIKLKKLNLYDNGIVDITSIGDLTNLEELKLGCNNESGEREIIGRAKLNNLINLKYLDFSNNKTSDIFRRINQLINLEELNLEGNNINSNNWDFKYVSNFTRLKRLNLFNNNIQSIEQLTKLDNNKIAKLISLQELIVQKNSIINLKSLFDDNNKIIFTNLKKLDISQNSIDKISNLRELEILCQKSNNCEIELNYEEITDESKLPHIDENGIRYVTYDDFGARHDGKYDDFIAIRNAHNFANRNNCEVRGKEFNETEEKVYHIFKYYEEPIIIKTNVKWDNVKFIIHDENIEDISGRYKSIFEVCNMNEEDIVSIENPNWKIGKLTNKINEIAEQLTNLNNKGYTQYLCAAINSNKKQYIRAGASTNNGDDQQDYFIVDCYGNVLNKIQWDFDNITSFVIYPISKTSISITGGEFVTNAISSKSETSYTKITYGKGKYFLRNILVKNASNVKISNIKHRLSYEENKDELSGSYKGFISCQNSAHIEIDSCTLFARKYTTSGRSTYDLIIDKSVDVKCINIDSNNIDDNHRWGITGTYFAKDVEFDKCILNRIDAHQGIYNLTVKDCRIGVKGLTLTGQGILNLIGTTIESNNFINLREDYGSTWNGNVNIINCTYINIGNTHPVLIGSKLTYDGYNLHDFGYDCKIPNLNIENLKVGGNNTENGLIFMNIENIKSEDEYKSNAEIFLENYLPKNIFVNKCYSENQENTNTLDFKIFNYNLNNYLENYNYIITNLNVTENDMEGRNILREIVLDDNYITNESVCFKIITNESVENHITIFKDGIEIDSIDIVNDYEKIFRDNGTYEVVLSTIEKAYNLKGNKVYKFTINNNRPNNDKDSKRVQELIVEDNLANRLLPYAGIKNYFLIFKLALCLFVLCYIGYRLVTYVKKES